MELTSYVKRNDKEDREEEKVREGVATRTIGRNRRIFDRRIL